MLAPKGVAWLEELTTAGLVICPGSSTLRLMTEPYQHASEMNCANVALQSSRTLSEVLGSEWQDLCGRYLSVAHEEPFWRYSRVRSADDPDQGWKLHIAATVLTANRVLEAIGPFLQERGVLFKGPVSLEALSKINCGVYYGYTLVGKCFTVYPQSTGEALVIAEKLHELTFGIPAPAVPFDLQLKPASCVYYRYGAFKYQQIDNGDGTKSLALRGPQGELVPDVRESPEAKPDWVTNPFPVVENPADRLFASPLKTTFCAFRALTQRGKGGVYQAVDFGSDPPRFCILKEGRVHGEPCWDGRDGFWRVKHEENVLGLLRKFKVNVPRVYSSFEVEGNFYLVTEFIEGVNLQAFLSQRKARLPIRRALSYGLQLARLMAQIHAAGWVWRDCKPANLMITKRGEFRPLDFEGACLIDETDPTPWGTPGFVPLESAETPFGQSRLGEDLYALGVMLHHLLSGVSPSSATATPLQKARRRVPQAVCHLVSQLLDADPARRPASKLVADTLECSLALP